MSILIECNYSNIERDLSRRYDKNYNLRTRENYRAIIDFLKDLKVKDLNELIEKSMEELPEED
jgi:hypothetical protein